MAQRIRIVRTYTTDEVVDLENGKTLDDTWESVIDKDTNVKIETTISIVDVENE